MPPMQKLVGGLGWKSALHILAGPCRLVCFPSHVVSLTVSALDHVSAFLSLQLSAMDVSARTPMKGAAKCDKHCELQNSVNQWKPERTLRFRDTPESLPASVSIRLCASSASCLAWCRCCVCLRAREPSRPWRAQRLGCSHVEQFTKHHQCSTLLCHGRCL